MLYGNLIDQNSKPTLDIGEGDPVFERIKSHGVNKDFWTDAFIFTSKDEYLTKTQIKYLESKWIDLAKDANRVELNNKNTSAEPTISEVDKAEVQHFFASIKFLVNVLNLSLFEPLSYRSELPQEDEILYEYKVKSYLGKMAIRDGKYVLLAGSTASKEFRKSAIKGIKQIRASLKHDGAIAESENGNGLTIVKDIPCNSPSRAAVIISGGNAAGPRMWKSNGKTLKELEQL